MFIAGFIIQYFGMSLVMTNQLSEITNSLGKVYIAVIMGLSMLVVEFMMHDHQYGVLSIKSYAVLAGLIGFVTFLYRKQVAIDDKQYVNEMIEHHSMALLTSNRILEKTDNYKVAKLAKNIIQKQEDEIAEMRDILSGLSHRF
jgi:Ca2+/Na+ antiporter